MYTLLLQEVRVLRDRGFAVLALGDFNARVGQIPGLEHNSASLNANTNLFKTFVQSLNLTILNTLPVSEGLFTHFVERDGVPYSESILDYGLSDPSLVPFISSFAIHSDLRLDCGTDHALLVSRIQFTDKNITVKTAKSDVLQFKLPDNKNFYLFDHFFAKHCELPPLDKFLELTTSEMAKTLTKTIFDSCCQAYLPSPAKRRKRKRWMPSKIVKHMKLRKFLKDKYVSLRSFEGTDSYQPELVSQIEQMLKKQQARVKLLLVEHQQARSCRKRRRLLMNDTKLNNFWKFVQQHCRATHRITASYNDSGDVVFTQPEVANEVVKKWSTVFSGQTQPVFSTDQLPPLPDLDPLHPLLKDLPHSPPKKHESFLCRPLTAGSLNKLLGDLKDNKSCGIDNIPSEILKYSGCLLKRYLLTFYNKVFEEGIVPESLNVVKCVLIHKSGDSLDMLNYRPIAVPNSLLRPITMRLTEDMSKIVEDEGILGKFSTKISSI